MSVRLWRVWAWRLICLTAGLTPCARAQLPGEDEPILPQVISESDLEMRGRFVRQWKEADGTLVLQFNGGFRLNLAERVLTSNQSVVWITPRVDDLESRKYYDLTVYLSEQAQARERAGSTVEDSTLLVSNLRTFGRVIKYHDAHAPENRDDDPLYRRALADRRLVEQADVHRRQIAEQRDEERGVEVARPSDAIPIGERRPPRQIRYDLPRIDTVRTEDGETCVVATGRVWFAQTGGSDAPTLEIQADNAVVFPAEGAEESLLGAPAAPVDAPMPQPPAPEAAAADGQTGSRSVAPAGRLTTDAGGARQNISKRIRSVYLEGDVVMTMGTRILRADRVYYDFELDRALLLDGVLRVDAPGRNIPLYVRADEIRQLSAKEFSARNARVTTSEFYTPHYHVGAEELRITDRTVRDSTGRQVTPLRGQYEITNATLNIENTPVAWWPHSTGELEASDMLLRRLRTGYSDDFGLEFETAWHLFNLLGVEKPPGVDATLRLDEYGRRGPGAGIDVDYQQKDQFGLLRSYYINDGGEDRFGPLRDNTPDSPNRGRVLWRHRHYLPNDWELSLETAYASDPGFLEEYEKAEWFEGKEQETAIYLKRARDTEALTFLANWRLLDFVTQTEHLPEFTYRRIGDTLGPFVSYSEARVGGVRYRPDDRKFPTERIYNNDGATDLTFRADGRQEFELPVKIPGLNVVPFITARGTYWDGQPLDGGGLWRGLGVYGVRGGSHFSRVFDEIRSELFDIDRIRHIIQPEFAVWWANSNADSGIITPFDEGIETIDDFYGGMIGARQTWQTKRGAGANRRTVDLLTLNLQLGFFGGNVQGQERTSGYVNPLRPEDSRTRNYLSLDTIYRLSDTTSLLYDFNFDLNDQRFDRHNLSIAVERLPRLAYVLGWRYADDIDLSLLGGGANYKISEKHLMGMRIWYDVDRGGLGEMDFTYIRKLPRWYIGFNIEVDQVFDDVSFSVSLWPEGIPEWTLGSRRFIGLTQSTGIRP